MARIKGAKRWNEISSSQWLSLFADPAVMSDLMMTIISSLYHAPDYTDNAKHIADTLSMEYRALNAAVGWAGNKIRDRYESGAFEEPARTAEKESAACRGSGKGIYPYRGGCGAGESSVGNGAVAVYFRRGRR
ncbi:hypothetical protein [Dialister invisus]|uniref:hypothetical protein n=1 Tax=Dialister invisus TaxID=218538 RepID=UPI0039A1D708